MTTIDAQMWQTRGTDAEWQASGSPLHAGQLGYATDTGDVRMGNGTDLWANLPTLATLPIAAADVAYTPGGGIAATNVQAAVAEARADAIAASAPAGSAVTTVNGEGPGAVTISAADVPFTAGGGIAATDVQAAVSEVRADAIAAAVTTVNGEGPGAVSISASDVGAPGTGQVTLQRIWDTSAARYVDPDGGTGALPAALPVCFIGSTDPVGATGGRANAGAAVIGDRWINVAVAVP